jgi:hypothetical protein
MYVIYSGYSAYISILKENLYFHEFGKSVSFLVMSGSRNTVACLIFGVILMSLDHVDIRKLHKAICAYSALASLWAIICSFKYMGSYGHAISTSVSATELSLMLPFSIVLSKKLRLGLILLISAAAFQTHAAIGLVACLAYIFFAYFYSIKAVLASVAAASIGLYITWGSYFWSFNGRLETWSLAYHQSLNEQTLLLGKGTGLFQFFFPIYQVFHNDAGRGLFIWMHSDVFQLAYETGILFTTTVVAYFLYLVTSRIRCNNSLAILSVIGLNSMFNFPFHQAPSFVLLILLISMIYNKSWKRDMDSKALI